MARDLQVRVLASNWRADVDNTGKVRNSVYKNHVSSPGIVSGLQTPGQAELDYDSAADEIHALARNISRRFDARGAPKVRLINFGAPISLTLDMSPRGK